MAAPKSRTAISPTSARRDVTAAAATVIGAAVDAMADGAGEVSVDSASGHVAPWAALPEELPCFAFIATRSITPHSPAKT